MTLPLNSRLSALYDTNGTQKDFSFGFRVFFDPDNGGYGLEVRRQTADGYEVIPKSDYLVLPVEDNSAGVVRFSVAPSAGQQIYIAGKTPTIQQLVLTNFGRYSAESIETQFDFITAIIQEWLSALGEETRQRIAADDILTQYVVQRIDDFVQQVNQNFDDKSQEIEDYINTIMPSFTQTLRDEIEAFAVAGMQDAIDQTLAESKAEIDDAVARANAAALAAAITGKVYDTPEAGVDPVTGVGNGAYYNVRSMEDDSYLVEYQNIGGVPTPSGKSYPSSAALQQINNVTIQNVDSIADLQYLAKWDGRTVQTKGYHKATNFALSQPYKGGALYIYVASRSDENDGFLCINGWVLQIVNNEVTPEQAGAKGDGSDDYVPLQKALSIGTPVTLSDTTYCTSKPLWHDSGKVIRGAGYQKTVIEKTTNSSESGLPTVTSFGKTIVQAVDAVLIARTWAQSYNHYSNISGLLLKHSNSLGSIGYGYYAPMFAEAQVQNVRTANCDIGIYSLDAWMIAWTRVTASANRPFVILGGTSNGFHECWATDAKGASSYAFQFENLYYSHMLSCGADFNGTDGSPIKALFRIVNSNITITSCASEFTHAYKFAHLQGAVVSFDQFQAMGFHNKYKTQSPSWGDMDALFDARSETNLKISRCAFGWSNLNKSTSPSFIDITDTSTLQYEAFKSTVTVDRVGANIPDNSNQFNISYGGGATSIAVDLNNYSTTGGERSNINGYSGIVPYNTGLAKPISRKSSHNITKLFAAGWQSTPLQLTTESINNIRGVGTSVFSQGDGTNGSTSNGYPANGGWHILQLGNLSEGNNLATNTSQLAIQFNSNKMAFRGGEWSSEFQGWNIVWHSTNTTVDSNGFIKRASPIVKLYSDKIELNDEAQQQNIEFEKLGVGDYLIKGSTGFSQEGWYIETPKDANGNVLFSVVYATLENNDISIKTYKKKFDVETASIVADLSSPVDITDGRWIDLRLNEADAE